MSATAGSADTSVLAWTGALLACSLLSAAVCTQAMRRGHGTRMFMRHLVASLVLVGVAAGSVAVNQLLDGTLGHLHDLLLLAAALVVAKGTALHPDLGPAPSRARYLVDAVIAGLSISTLVWLGFARLDGLGQIPAAQEGAIIAAIAVVFAVARTGIAITLHRARGSVEESASAMLAAAFAVCSLGGIAHLLADTVDPSPLEVASGYGVLTAGTAMFGVTALLVLRPRQLRFRITRRRLHSLFDLIPVSVAVVATGALLLDAALRGSFDPTAALLLTIVVSSVLLRQTWTLTDNRVLASSLRRTVDDLERQATHDSLTGLPNRGGLSDRIDRSLREAIVHRRSFAVCFVDIDHLKTINDSLGHRAGDRLIAESAQRLAAGFGDAVTRFGGDEFVVTFELERAALHDRPELGTPMVAALAEPLHIDGQKVHPSCSVGVVVVDSWVAASELLRRADVALYQAKALGRNCASVYDPELDTGLMADLDLAPELRRAIERDEFTLHYQPIVELGTRRTARVEALLRWHHPERGLLAPDAFLDEAVSAGLLGAIGELSLQRACRDMATLGAALGPHQPSVSVNLSSSELADLRAVDRVRTALELASVPPHQLTIEITEDVIVDDAVREVIAEIRQLGVGLAVDDFGTGNSSMRQLGAYNADVLKIDRSFVDRITHDRRALLVTSSIVELASDLGMATVAEGVETEEQERALTEMGCTFAQGWHVSRPMPIAELLERCVSEAAASHAGRDRASYARPASAASASSMMRPSRSATEGLSSMAPTT